MRRTLTALLALCAPAAAAALTGGGPADDDLVPATLEALLAEPDDPFFFGEKEVLPAEVLVASPELAGARSLLGVGDVTGDGLPDLAVGGGPGTARPWRVLDGAGLTTVWEAPLGDGAFRGARGLVLSGDRLVAAGSSSGGTIACRDVAMGQLLWTRDLAVLPGPGAANLSGLRLGPDVDGDGLADLLVAGGHRVDRALCLSAANGRTLWRHVTDEVVYDLVPVHDLDGDGVPEALAVGGDELPNARLLDGDDGSVRWAHGLPGPGTVALALDDVDGSGVPDLAVGLWNEPGPCLLALDGASGDTLWQSGSVTRDVTDLQPLGDLVGTGLTDVLVASLDNATSGVLALNGISEWRREGTTNNGGHMPFAAVLGDLDGDGLAESAAASQDHQLYFMGGRLGQFIAGHDHEARTSALTVLGDADGDGAPDLALAGNGGLTIVSGLAGLAGGPVQELTPAPLGQSWELKVYAYPGTQLYVLAAAGLVETPLPGFAKPLGLEPATLLVYFQGTAPGAGGSVFNLPPFDAGLVGLTVYLQSASLYEPGFGLLSDVLPLTVRP